MRGVDEDAGRQVHARRVDRGHSVRDIEGRQGALKNDGLSARTEHGQREGVDWGDGFGLILGHKQDASGQSY